MGPRIWNLSRELRRSLRFPADRWLKSSSQRLIAVGCRFESCRHHQLVRGWQRLFRSFQILGWFLRSSGQSLGWETRRNAFNADRFRPLSHMPNSTSNLFDLVWLRVRVFWAWIRGHAASKTKFLLVPPGYKVVVPNQRYFVVRATIDVIDRSFINPRILRSYQLSRQRSKRPS